MHKIKLKYFLFFLGFVFVNILNAYPTTSEKKEKLYVAGGYNAVPYSYYDQNGNAAGFDIDLFLSLTKVTNYNPEIKLYNWADARKDMEQGKYDVLLGIVSTDLRGKKVDFTEPYLFLENVIVVRKGENKINSATDLKEKEIIVVKESKNYEDVIKSGFTPNVISVSSPEQALLLLASGKHDCAVVLKIQADYLINDRLLINLKSLDKPFSSSEYCFAVRKGDSTLLHRLNTGLEVLRLNKEYEKIYNKWFNESKTEIHGENRKIYYLLIAICILTAFILILIFNSLAQRKRIKKKTEEFQKELTDRKRIETILIEREELLNQASKIARLGNWVWDGNTNVLICSPEVFDILGFVNQADTLSVDDFYSSMHSDDREMVKQAVQKSFLQRNDFEAEFRVVHPGGTIKHVRSKAVFSFVNGKTLSMTGVMQDITEYKTALLKVEYSNRLNSFLSQVNEAIVHYPNIDKLFYEICRIGVEFGKFELVWVGIVDVKSGWVKAESSFGNGKEYFAVQKISIKDDNYGRGTVGLAYRNGTYAYINDLTNSDKNLHAKRESLQLGFRSEASFVIKKEAKIIGTISYYSNELNFFNESEIKLLEEIADNISFAIDNVEKENVRKITRRALQESQKKYLSVFNAVSDPIFLLDQNSGSILDANEAACRLYGFSYDELLNKKIMDISAEPNETAVTLIDKIEVITNRFHKRKDNSIFPVEVMSTYFVQDNRKFSVAVIRDLTETLKSKEKLLESEKRYSSLFQHNRAVMILFESGTGAFVDVNPAACKFYGYSKEHFLNMTIADINTLTTKECFEEIEKVTKYESSQLFFKHRLAGGEIRDVEAFTGAMNLIGKQVYYSIIYDITERRKAELELIAAKDKAEEANRLKTSLLGNMSHELRTPLTGILGFSQILLEEISDDFLKDMVDKILRSGKRLMTTLNSILNISELESNKYDVRLTELNLAYSIKNRLYDFEKNAAEKKLTFEFKSLDNEIFVYSDENFLNQILESLVDNAIKYTEIGGVEVIVDSENDDGNFWGVLKVVDTGIGIPSDLHNMIFEEFRQASEGFNRSFEGSGLGLTLAKKMVALLGGSIHLESELGKGSVFTVRFPGYLEFASEQNVSAIVDLDITDKIDTISFEMTNLSEIKTKGEELPLVLLVEDNYINSDVTIMFLRGICTIDHALDGENAINMAATNQYNAILMDINLGGKMNGIEALKEIRQIPGYELIPVVALTGYAMSGDKDRLMNEGFDNYMSKPFEKDDIVNLVKMIIKK